MNKPRVVWGEYGFASESGWAFTHCVNQSTGEILYSQDVWVSVGTGLPSGAFLDVPPQPEDGKAIVRQDGAWALVDDYRGRAAYNKQTRQALAVDALGPLPSTMTLTPPSSQLDVWDDLLGLWVVDKDAENAQAVAQAEAQKLRLNVATEQSIKPLERAKQLDIATPSELAALTEWERYSVLLMRVDTSKAPDIDWPSVPTV